MTPNKQESLSLSDLQPILGLYANSTDPVQTPQKAASDQGQHCLFREISVENTIKKISFTRNP